MKRYIVNAAISLIIGFTGISTAYAGSVYCNKIGDTTTVCNQYSNDGSGKMESTYYNQYGDTVIGNNYNDHMDN